MESDRLKYCGKEINARIKEFRQLLSQNVCYNSIETSSHIMSDKWDLRQTDDKCGYCIDWKLYPQYDIDDILLEIDAHVKIHECEKKELIKITYYTYQKEKIRENHHSTQRPTIECFASINCADCQKIIWTLSKDYFSSQYLILSSINDHLEHVVKKFIYTDTS